MAMKAGSLSEKRLDYLVKMKETLGNEVETPEEPGGQQRMETPDKRGELLERLVIWNKHQIKLERCRIPW